MNYNILLTSSHNIISDLKTSEYEISCLSNKHFYFLFIIIPFIYSRQVVSNMEKYLLQLLFVHNISKNIK
jgi:hypothetical protein